MLQAYVTAISPLDLVRLLLRLRRLKVDTYPTIDFITAAFHCPQRVIWLPAGSSYPSSGCAMQ
jgi:hypothetical protein